jgi:hypothetical protein
MKKANKVTSISIIRALVAILVFFSPNIVRAFEIENPTISYAPVCEVAREYDSYINFSGEKSIEVINDLDSWFNNQTKKLCMSESLPLRALGECWKESNENVRPSAKEVSVGFTKFIVNQCHAIVETWFSKG